MEQIESETKPRRIARLSWPMKLFLMLSCTLSIAIVTYCVYAFIHSLAELNSLSGADLPADTVLLGGVYRRGWHYDIVAKVRLRRSEIAPYLRSQNLDPLTDMSANAGAQEEKGEMSNPKYTVDTVPGWDVAALHHFYETEGDYGRTLKPYTAGYGRIIIDLDSGSTSENAYLWFSGD